MFKENQFSSLKILEIENKKIYVVDRHQYTLPIWAYNSLLNNKSYILVSIDYHPDTNPPFWQESHYKAILKDDEKANELTNEIIKKRLIGIDRNNINEIIKLPNNLNNDEHINTAMELDYLNDYHMINCMDKHEYKTGKHYLLKKEYFSSLEDEMFKSIGFNIPKREFILDIDLDFFLKKDSFEIKNDSIIKKLVKDSKIITIARSKKYFEYLKKENFELDECETLTINMIRKIIKA